MDATKRPLLIPPEFATYAETHGVFEMYQVNICTVSLNCCHRNNTIVWFMGPGWSIMECFHSDKKTVYTWFDRVLGNIKKKPFTFHTNEQNLGDWSFPQLYNESEIVFLTR